MKIIQGGRQAGKTTQIIKECAESGGYIVCADHNGIRNIKMIADKLKINIPHPLTFSEFLKKQYSPAGIRKVHIDDAGELLQSLSMVEIATISI